MKYKARLVTMLPLVPERPSLENRELSPVPDIVSPTSPMLTQPFHNQNTYAQPRPARRDSRQGGESSENNLVKIFTLPPLSRAGEREAALPRVRGGGGAQRPGRHAAAPQEQDPHGHGRRQAPGRGQAGGRGRARHRQRGREAGDLAAPAGGVQAWLHC